MQAQIPDFLESITASYVVTFYKQLITVSHPSKERLRWLFLKYVPKKYQNKKLGSLADRQTGLTTLTDPDLEVVTLEVFFVFQSHHQLATSSLQPRLSV